MKLVTKLLNKLLTKRTGLILFFTLFAWLIIFLWNNALVLDDFHHANWDDNQAEIDAWQSVDDTLAGDESQVASISPDSSSEQTNPALKKGFYIYINLDQTTMYVYKNGELIKTYPVSGGKPNTPSPVGTWKIVSKDTWGEGFGGAWLGFNVPWGKYGIHGTVEPWFVGKSNQSKGCIRMKNKDVRELYTIVPHGATVTIVHDAWVFRSLKSGDVGTDVLNVQKALKKLGYYQGYPDGKFGDWLGVGVKKFQKDNKLRSNGVVNRSAYDLIMKKLQAMEAEKEEMNKPLPVDGEKQ